MFNEEIGIIEKGLKVRNNRRGFGKLESLSIKGINPWEEEIKRIRKKIARGEYRVGVIDLARKIVRDEVSRILSNQ